MVGSKNGRKSIGGILHELFQKYPWDEHDPPNSCAREKRLFLMQWDFPEQCRAGFDGEPDPSWNFMLFLRMLPFPRDPCIEAVGVGLCFWMESPGGCFDVHCGGETFFVDISTKINR
jgi:hypothetical protein